MNQQRSRLNQKIERELGELILQLLEDKKVCEIMLNTDGNIWVERFGRGMTVEGKFSATRARSLMSTLATSFDVTLTRKNPILECELPLDGSRFEGLIPPVVSSPVFTIRKMASAVFTLDNYLELDTISLNQKKHIEDAIKKRKNILIAGGTGSGKTTLVNAVLDAISGINPDHRLVIMEDTKELQCSCKNFVSLQTSETRNMTDLLRVSMRMRPDRIVLGEVRGGEALAMLKAWNTGHPGGVATVHANSAYEALSRIEQLVAESTLAPSQELIASAVDLVVFVKKTKNGRRVEELLKVNGYDGSDYITEGSKYENFHENKKSYPNGWFVVNGGFDSVSC